ncbi:MAG: DUF533 domain-containing protein [Nitrosomonadales bacterium]|nr:DUF533 domain-containing protein [Nitrosomonadales bacterium]
MQDINQAILSIAVLASFADGKKAEVEREQIRSIMDSLQTENSHLDLAKLYQDVLLKRVDLATAAARIKDHSHRQLAYEMAVCVCDADGVMTAEEARFLQELKSHLQLDDTEAEEIARPAHAIAAVSPIAATSAISAYTTTPSAKPATISVSSVPEAELDKSILNYSILNGALELLPQSWASMAIIPLQIKMVFEIGKSHGYQLDKGHITEFLTTAGVGMTSQYLEQFGRKLIGGLLGQIGGGLGKRLGRAATGVAFSFATTYALGHLAKRYYSGGRQMETAVLKDTFQQLLGPAKNLQQQYIPQIQQRASTLDAGSIMNMVRGV